MQEHADWAKGGLMMAKELSASGVISVVTSFVAKAFMSPGVIGVLAAFIAFVFKWPKTAKEGVPRVIAHAACVYMFGDILLRTLAHFMPWVPMEEMRVGAYLLAGLPGWFLLHALFEYFRKNEDKSIDKIAKDVANALKEIKK